ncbi:MAG: DUF2254 family protein [Pirellulaceae bacterium]|nr:DUF2254 family protein [Pirellulaceae bacterium]
MWFKPLVFCFLSIAAVFLADLLDRTSLNHFLPEVSESAIASLLQVLASSMLAIATFSVGAMVSAYAAASNSATPRSFPLIVADDVSQNALSVFIGSFIYSVVAIVALKSGLFETTHRSRPLPCNKRDWHSLALRRR